MNATVTPATANNKKLDWFVEPANAGVTVSNGKVTAKSTASGTYAVYAKSKDGSDVTSNKCIVSVVAGAISKIKVPKSATIFTTSGSYDAPTTYTISPEITGTVGFDKSLISYTSSAPGVATVDPTTGEVTAKAPGKAVITVAATDGSKKTAKITINVNVPMSKLTIAPKGGCQSYIAVDGKVSFGVQMYEAYGDPTNKKIKWSIENIDEEDDTIYASVDSAGKVTGKEIGTAILVAEAADGSGVIAGYLIQIVKKPTYFYLSGKGMGGYIKVNLVTNSGIINETVGYKIEITGNGAYVKQTEMAKNYFYLRATKPGNYTIKVTLLDGSNKSYKLYATFR